MGSRPKWRNPGSSRGTVKRDLAGSTAVRSVHWRWRDSSLKGLFAASESACVALAAQGLSAVDRPRLGGRRDAVFDALHPYDVVVRVDRHTLDARGIAGHGCLKRAALIVVTDSESARGPVFAASRGSTCRPGPIIPGGIDDVDGWVKPIAVAVLEVSRRDASCASFTVSVTVPRQAGEVVERFALLGLEHPADGFHFR